MSDDRLRAHVIAAAREFNAGRYFEAHEQLEDALDAVPDEEWTLFVGLIQIAVGYHKASQGLAAGAERMLSIGLEKVAAYPERAGGVELGGLRERARADRDALHSGADPLSILKTPPRLMPLPHSAR